MCVCQCLSVCVFGYMYLSGYLYLGMSVYLHQLPAFENVSVSVCIICVC
jgi:hypothetical protein